MIIISALLYVLPFIYTQHIYGCMFIWMIPLLVYDEKYRYGFTQGYLWGIVFYAIHLIWIGHTLYIKGYICIAIFIYIFFVIYLAIFAGLWFVLKQQLYRYLSALPLFQQQNSVAFCLAWIISTVTFMYVTCSCSFALFDCFEGYSLSNPLLTLVTWRWFVNPLFYVHEICYWFLIVFINIILYRLLIKFDINALIYLICIMLLLSCFQWNGSSCNLIFDDIQYVQPYWNVKDYTACETFYTISREIDLLAVSIKPCSCIVMPEGSFPYNLLDWQDKLDAWTSLLLPTQSIFIGAQRHIQGKIYNSLFHIQNGKIVGWYDKQHLVFGVERSISWLSSLFLLSEQAFTLPDTQNKLILHGFQPVICSELFCNQRVLTKTAPILFICCDEWFSCSYIYNLGLNAALLKSVACGVPLIYVGSSECFFLS